MAMTPNERVLDDCAHTRVGDVPPVPQSVGALFADLRLTRADDVDRLRELLDWLIHHEPSKRLIRGLAREGYAGLIAEAAAKR
ncbi:hypothetical protein [Gordonia aquimaris]|uniref:Uncharacterized protein n=1 Tax=Gordonia aquimaris TaxID=2984863 RepID=A0A9X3I6R9_9ACTN|nr:hypothetical protein [Gordonia aquimaris]MCX2966345.1 hypothetical protein [Gordonia aquimaris]